MVSMSLFIDMTKGDFRLKKMLISSKVREYFTSFIYFMNLL